MDRREAIKLGLAGSCLGMGSLAARAQTAAPAPTSKVSGLTATITLNGASYVYRAEGGKNWGNFSGPGFQHNNIQAAHPSPDIPAFEVYFRSDLAPGTRHEVIFELGKCWGAANAAAHHLLPNAQGIAYHVEIRDGDKVLAHGDAPKHWWFARWRWQSAPRPIVVTPSQGMSEGLFPPIGSKGVPGNLANQNFSRYFYTDPMSDAKVTEHMPGTGERNDIGVVTEIGANWLLNPSDKVAEFAMRSWGEVGAGSVPWIWRDENTGAPVSLIDHPLINDEWHQFDGYHPRDPKFQIIGNGSTQLIDANGYNTSGWAIDTAHQPALCYLPAVATGDSYFLEGLQFQTNKCFTQTPYWSTQQQAYLPLVEDRGYWWSLRTLAEAWKATLLAEARGALPPWLLPSRYYKTLLDAQLKQFTKLYVNNPTRAGTYFAAGPELNAVGTWQHGFRGKVLNHVYQLGLTEWLPVLKWAMKSQILRVSFAPARSSVYYLSLCPGKWALQSKGLGEDGDPRLPLVAADYAPDWKTVLENSVTAAPDQWAGRAEFDALLKDPSHGGTLSPSQSQDYAWDDWSALSYAVYNGLSECIHPLSLLTPLLAHTERSARNSFMSSRDGAVPPPPQ